MSKFIIPNNCYECRLGRIWNYDRVYCSLLDKLLDREFVVSGEYKKKRDKECVLEKVIK